MPKSSPAPIQRCSRLLALRSSACVLLLYENLPSSAAVGILKQTAAVKKTKETVTFDVLQNVTAEISYLSIVVRWISALTD